MEMAMPKARYAAAVAAVALALFAPLAQTAPIYFDAALAGANETPPVVSPGTGFATVVLDPVAHTLRVIVNFSGLIGLTTVAHVHCCVASPGNVGVATQTPSFAGFPVGVQAGTYDNTFDTTLASSFNASFITANGGTPATAEAALLAGLLASSAYMNVHSTFAPGGEIRGFLVQRVPEPATIVLVGAALLALGLMRQQRRRAHARR
jgi:hypothetical protein